MTSTTDLTRVAARLMLIPIFVVAIGVMVTGYADVGDGFSAGVIASLGVALQVLVFGPSELARLPLVQKAPKGTFLGLFIALLTVFVPAIRGEPLMTHWPRAGEEVEHFGALELITPVAFDVGVFLVVFGFGVGVTSSIARSQARMTSGHQPATRTATGERAGGEV